MTDKRTPRHRWLQFSLRTMLVVVTVFCIWLGITAKRARDQRLAVDAIRELGGEVRYDHDKPNSEPPGPAWLRRLIGDDYFFSVRSIKSTGSKFNDESLATVGRLTDVKVMELSYNQITDAGLGHLKGLTNLQRLYLRNTQITDEGLEHLKGLTNLALLALNGTNVTDDGVKKLQQALPNCTIHH